MSILDSLLEQQKFEQQSFDRAINQVNNVIAEHRKEKLKKAGQFLLDHPDEAGLRYVVKQYNLSPPEVHDLVTSVMTFNNYVDSQALEQPIGAEVAQRLQNQGYMVNPNMSKRAAMEVFRATPNKALNQSKINLKSGEVTVGGTPTENVTPDIFNALINAKKVKTTEEDLALKKYNAWQKAQINAKNAETNRMNAVTNRMNAVTNQNKSKVKVKMTNLKDLRTRAGKDLQLPSQTTPLGALLKPNEYITKLQVKGYDYLQAAQEYYNVAKNLKDFPHSPKYITVKDGKVLPTIKFATTFALDLCFTDKNGNRVCGDDLWKQQNSMKIPNQ